MPITAESFRIIPVYICVLGADGQIEEKLQGYEVWLEGEFIGPATSYKEARAIVKKYLSDMEAKTAPVPKTSWSHSPS